ncbi:hypothetical protein PGT21_003148 [Puccinia graminis f. sp. tritici]|uniref:Uncharacterized protein n=1 Tax=Puccinia graminis f. sp. tritici TaxID=56615 RepID=A0A5B0PQ83_PUCGR|nr:hypothetical protein PGT21_003443 [Puccinia graminis f. sp. tritici]KAA1080140.1 hypothetical protein PGTUg99_016202 [Puccinia graminis f. sp. tritici]KAA1103867.1 hypothetical protein PGT21_003148 [Puccinia graminis f. sp. tritici]
MVMSVNLKILNNKRTINSPSVLTEEPKVHHQTRQSEQLKFQTSHPLLTRYPVNIAPSPAVLDTVGTPSGKVSLALRARHEIARRARIEDARKVDPGNITTTDDSLKSTPVQPSTEPPRKKISIPKQVASATTPASNTKPTTFADNVANPNTKPTPPGSTTANPPAKAPAVDPNPPITNSRTPINPTPSAPPNNTAPAKSALPPSTAVTPLTPTPEASPEATAKTAPSGTVIANKPAVESVTPTAPTTPLVPSPAANVTAQREVTPHNHTESAKVEAVPQGSSKVNTSQLTSIAIGVACAASLVIFAILVVIFKIRVCRKRARRTEKLGDDFFGSQDRLSFSDSAGSSRKSLFLVPRPIGNKFPESAQEKPASTFGSPNHAGIGAHSPQIQSLADAPRNHSPSPLTLQTHSNYVPPRPPRSPLRAQTVQKPDAFYHPQKAYAGSEHYTQDSQSMYSIPATRAQANAPEFYGQPTHEYEYAMEYLENYYPDNYESSAYTSNVDPPGPAGLAKNHKPEMIGMEFMQVEDRPYDHRYTVDRNGVLNNYTPSIPSVPVPRESDYFYKKRVS